MSFRSSKSHELTVLKVTVEAYLLALILELHCFESRYPQYEI